MSEPRLEDIGDYDKLTGEKKRVVWIVIAVGLAIGLVFAIADSYYGTANNMPQHNNTTKILQNK